MAKKPDELLKLVEPWGIAKETKKYMDKYLKKKGKTVDVDSWIRDRRTAEQFADQLLAYWAVEDAFANWLERNLRNLYPDAKVELAGTDKSRKIIEGQSPRGKVTGEPDYKVSLDGDSKIIPIEFQFAAVDITAYDVKKNKVRKAEKGGVVFFAFLPIQKFTLMTADFIKTNGKDFINPRIGGKNTWNIEISKIIMKDKDYQITKEDLLSGFIR